jgi:hypothetical protein
MNNRSIFVVVFALVAGLASAQGWSEAYGKALTALGQGDWAIAKGHFTDAVALRPEDQSDPTSLPGPVTDPRRWRDGAPYSPNFGIAYTSYKLALQLEGVDRNNALAEAGKLFEALMARRQTSVETVYFLNQIYSWTACRSGYRRVQVEGRPRHHHAGRAGSGR